MNLFQGANRGRLFEWGRGPLKKTFKSGTNAFLIIRPLIPSCIPPKKVNELINTST